MAIVVNVKTTQILPKITSWRPQEGFFVEDDYTKGLKKATFGTIITGKSGGRVAPVISYAGAVGATYTDIAEAPVALGPAKAIGIIYETSPIDQYRRVDDLSDETRLFPLGSRTDKKYALMPSCVLEVTDTDEVNGTVGYFRLVDKALPTATAFDDATATIVFDGNVNDIRVEEKLEIDGDFYWIVDIEYDSVADETTVTLNEGAGDVVKDVVVKSQLFETAYLADDMAGDVPFTMIPEVGRQAVGFVESMFALRVSTLNII
jgi:hypothetical protein